jgi:hypothetical protein
VVVSPGGIFFVFTIFSMTCLGGKGGADRWMDCCLLHVQI